MKVDVIAATRTATNAIAHSITRPATIRPLDVCRRHVAVADGRDRLQSPPDPACRVRIFGMIETPTWQTRKQGPRPSSRGTMTQAARPIVSGCDIRRAIRRSSDGGRGRRGMMGTLGRGLGRTESIELLERLFGVVAEGERKFRRHRTTLAAPDRPHTVETSSKLDDVSGTYPMPRSGSHEYGAGRQEVARRREGVSRRQLGGRTPRPLPVSSTTRTAKA